MGFGHRVYRAEDPRARVLRRTAQELDAPRYEVAEALEKAALAELKERRPDRVLETNVEFWAAIVLDFAEVPAEHVHLDVHLRPHRRLVGAHPRAEAHRPADPPVARSTPARRRARPTSVEGWNAEWAADRPDRSRRMTRPTLHTARLTLRPLTDDDLPHLVALNGDPEVMRFITGRALTPAEVAADLPGCTGSERGLGLWSGTDADGVRRRLVPRRGPRRRRRGGDRLAPPAAPLGSRARRRRGPSPARRTPSRPSGLERVWAETMAVNARSRAVMERLGMRHTGTEVREWEDPIPGWEQGEVVYELTREDAAVALWDDEAQTFDEAADHGLRDPGCARPGGSCCATCSRPRRPGSPTSAAAPAPCRCCSTEEGYAVTGVDFSPEMILRARAKVPGGRVRRGRRGRAPARPRGLRRRAEPPRALGDARPGGRPGALARPARARRAGWCWSRAAGRPGPG